MNGMNERDEMLERLWQLRERGCSNERELARALKDRWRREQLDALERDGLAERAGEEITLTERGASAATGLIRAHRIGERLIHDVLGREFESGACELEHILATDIVDSICTLLGHPRECPHGFPIPEGECCRVSARYVQRVIVPLTELKIGQTARVAYVYAQNDQQLHRLTSLQIRPGTVVRLHQEYPSYVIECDGASIALDAEVARNINVWIEGGDPVVREIPAAEEARPSFARPRWRWGFGGRRRG